MILKLRTIKLKVKLEKIFLLIYSLGLSEDAIKDLIRRHVEPLWKALEESQATSMKERAQMKVKMDELHSSKEDLKKQVEDLKNEVLDLKNQNKNFSLNNAQSVDRVERVETENAGLKEVINELKTLGLEKVNF